MEMVKQFFIIFIGVLITSCRSPYLVVQDYYLKDEVIEIPFYVYWNCDYKPLFFPWDCNNNKEDSLLPIFSKLFIEKGFTIPENIENRKSVLEDTTKGWVNHNKLDTISIKNYVSDKTKLSLVPVINFVEVYDGTPSGTNYDINLSMSVFLIKNNNFKYINFSSISSERIFFVYEKELEEFKSSIEIEKLINELIEKALQPYIERLR